MFLDEDGLARTVRWGEALERGHSVNWREVIAALPLVANDRDRVHERLRDLGVAMKRLPEIMRSAKVDEAITERRAAAIGSVRDGLSKL